MKIRVKPTKTYIYKVVYDFWTTRDKDLSEPVFGGIGKTKANHSGHDGEVFAQYKRGKRYMDMEVHGLKQGRLTGDLLERGVIELVKVIDKLDNNKE